MQIPNMIAELSVIQMMSSPHVVVLVAVILRLSANAHRTHLYLR